MSPLFPLSPALNSKDFGDAEKKAVKKKAVKKKAVKKKAKASEADLIDLVSVCDTQHGEAKSDIWRVAEHVRLQPLSSSFRWMFQLGPSSSKVRNHPP